MNTVPVAEIKHMAVHDGPGMRTTVFLKGCPLHCIWCHNPACISAAPELLFRAARCTACRRCEAVCPHRAHRFTLNGHEFRRGLCDGCGACAEVCPAGALTLCGRSAAAGELYDELMEDADFYRISGGGVTLSGGEPLLYPAFCRELCAVLGRAGIHRALDTSAAVPWEAFETVLPETDLPGSGSPAIPPPAPWKRRTAALSTRRSPREDIFLLACPPSKRLCGS